MCAADAVRGTSKAKQMNTKHTHAALQHWSGVVVDGFILMRTTALCTVRLQQQQCRLMMMKGEVLDTSRKRKDRHTHTNRKKKEGNCCCWPIVYQHDFSSSSCDGHDAATIVFLFLLLLLLPLCVFGRKETKGGSRAGPP